jgi:hypothetical protein
VPFLSERQNTEALATDPYSEDLARAVAGYGLPLSKVTLPGAPLDDERWAAFFAKVASERLGGLLSRAVSDGALAVTDEQGENVLDLHRAEMDCVIRLEQALLETVTRLEGAGISFRVMKGAALCHLAYADPALRAFGDVDLMVEPSRIDDAVAVLTGSGCRREFPELRPGFDRRFGKGVSMIRADGAEVDLHRMLTEGRFGLTVDLEAFFQPSIRFRLGDATLPALAPEELFVSACFNAAIGNREPRLNALRDIAELLVPPARLPIDVELVLARCRSWRVEAVLARGVRLAWSSLRLPPSAGMSEWALAYVTSRADERALLAHTGEHRSWAAQALLAVGSVPGARAKAAYLSGALLPGRVHLDSRGVDRRTRWRHAWGVAGRIIRS